MPGKLKVYISSTFLDLQGARQKIIDRINKGLSPNFELTEIMEKMDGDPANRTNVDICRAEVRKADLYILLTGKRYGSYPDEYKNKQGKVVQNTECLSYTELEYDAACETNSEKFYGIYKFELTGEFFESEGIKDESDFSIPGREERYTRFQNKLDKTVSSIQIKSGIALQQKINDKLTEYFLSYNTKEVLKITPVEKASIDRKQQLSKVRLLRQQGGIDAGVFVFLIELENENDCNNEFTIKLQTELSKKAPNVEVNFIRSSVLANLIATDGNNENLLKQILTQCSSDIYGDIMFGASFERLAKDLDTKGIQNVFINFLVDQYTDGAGSPLNFAEVVAEFVKKIDSILKARDFGYNFYFPVYFFSQKDENSLEKYKSHFNNLPCLTMGKLPDVKLEDAIEWMENIRQGRSINDDVNSLLHTIFIDENFFPTKYKNCITLIDKRTK